MKYRVKTEVLRFWDEGDILILEGNGYEGVDKNDFIQKEIVERNPEWFEPVLEVEVGQYWNIGTCIARIAKLQKDTVGYTYIGQHQPKGIYFDNKVDFLSDCTLLTDDQVEQALIEEAKRRGYKKGVRAKISRTGVIGTVNTDLRYRAIDDALVGLKGGYSIYSKGNWAKIIEDEWKVEQEINPTHYRVVNRAMREINVHMGKAMSKKEAEAIADALNGLDQ